MTIVESAIHLAAQLVQDKNGTVRLSVMQEIGRGRLEKLMCSTNASIRRGAFKYINKFARGGSTATLDTLFSGLGGKNLLDLLASTIADGFQPSLVPVALQITKVIVLHGSIEHKKHILGQHWILEGLSNALANRFTPVGLDFDPDGVEISTAVSCLLDLACTFGPHPAICNPMIMASLRNIVSNAAKEDGGFLVEAQHTLQILEGGDRHSVLSTQTFWFRYLRRARMNVSAVW
ncbi:hypothetical protein OF83DRAFT_882312 [Amylostereum chailletii]|nr:hypothetical protein OF83DRAFT_882312 [Amylostereum chailletii]